MGDYKLLNRELIDANRELKQLVATLQKEVVLLRAEVVEQHRLRIEAEYNSRERILTLAKNFLSSINEIDSNVNVMELLGFKDFPQNGNSGTLVAASEQSDGSARSSRRSTQLVKDFRRTSAVCRQQSVVHMSPTRRVHEEDAGPIDEEESESEAIAARTSSDMDLDDNSINEDNIIDVEKDDDTADNLELDCINEGSDEECEHQAELSKSKADAPLKQKPLRDLSNQIIDNTTTNKLSNITVRGKQHERLSENENYTIEMARDLALDGAQTPTQFDLDMDIEDDLVNTMERSLHLTPARAPKERVDTQQKSVVCSTISKRHVVVRLQRLHEPLPLTTPHIVVHNATQVTITPQVLENLDDVTRKHDAAELSLGLTEYSMANFSGAHCSTPCHNEAAKKSAIKDTADGTVTATRSNDVSNSNSFDSSLAQGTRPSRRCTPKTLVEPSLKEKLRNESKSARSKQRSKSKKR